MSDQAQANICESHHFIWTWPINDPGHGSIGVCDLCGAVKVDECRPMRDPMTGDDLAEKVAAVLPDALHAADDLPDDCSPEDVFRAVAAALLPLIREREAAAWDRALETVAAGVESAMEAHREHGHRESVSTLSGLLTAIPRTASPYAGSEGGE